MIGRQRHRVPLSRAKPATTILAVIIGQVIGGIGILIQFAAEPDRFSILFGIPFPPGVIYIAGAAAIVWLDQRSTWSPTAAIALSAWIVFGGLAGGALTEGLSSSDAVVVSGNLVMILGLLASSAAGVVAVIGNRRVVAEREPFPLSVRSPRRAPVIVTVAGLVAAGVGLAGAERLNFVGPGPFPFAILAIAVACVRGRYVAGLAIVLSMVFLGGALSNPEALGRLSNPSDSFGFGFTVLHCVSLVITIIAGIAANLPARPAGAGPATDHGTGNDQSDIR